MQILMKMDVIMGNYILNGNMGNDAVIAGKTTLSHAVCIHI